MQIFYAHDIDDNTYVLDQNESKHIIKVLRMTRGTEVRLIDGKGNLYEGVISDPDSRACGIRIINVRKDFEKRNYRLHVAISPLKNHDRFEWFTEKCVEIGIDEITPLICRKTEKHGIRPDRINNLIISAMKQSLKARKTIFNEPKRFSDIFTDDFIGTKMIAHCNKSFTRQKLSEAYHKDHNALILIGPEGDFTEEEISRALQNEYISVHLGNSRLRTETAGVAACHSIYFINQ